jgi:uncharacterized protein YegP (UPF0339 family)
MATHVFTIVMDRAPTDLQFDALMESGCDDAAFIVDRDIPLAEFDRDAPTLAHAIATAVRDIEAAGLKALRVVDGDLLTLADIADRIGRSRETVRRYAVGERGGGGFPPPVTPARDGTAFYRWSEVAAWIKEHVDAAIVGPDVTLVLANLLLQARLHRSNVPEADTLVGLLDAAHLGRESTATTLARMSSSSRARVGDGALLFEIYRDESRKYRWRLKRMDAVIATGQESYGSRKLAEKAIRGIESAAVRQAS